MLTSPEINELLDIVSRKQYQRNHPSALKFLKSVQGFTEIGVQHANTFEAERADFLFDSLNFKGFRVLDIGANIGYFSIAAAEHGAQSVVAYEGEEDGAKLLTLLAKSLNYSDVITSLDSSFNFAETATSYFDAIICLNVLHHIGRYFEDSDISKEDAMALLVKHLNALASQGNYCCFQMGYNWKGDESQPLFAGGSKGEMIEFLTEGIKEVWEVHKIGLLVPDSMRYEECSEDHLNRFDELGEFGNRPIFILKNRN